MKVTLEQILEKEKARRVENGLFGINQCKKEIKWNINFIRKRQKKYKEITILFNLLEDYLKRAQEDEYFYKRMILACWELINEQ